MAKKQNKELVMIMQTGCFGSYTKLRPNQKDSLRFDDKRSQKAVMITRQHSSRMHTIRLETPRASISVATNKCHLGEGGMSPN